MDGLAAERALLREYHIIGPPGAAAVGTALAAHHRGELHVVLPFHAVQLGCIHGPHLAAGGKEQRGILLAAMGIAGNQHRLAPPAAALFQAGADHADVGAALVGAGKPRAQKIAVFKLQQGRGMSGCVGAWGQHRLHGSHRGVFIHGAVRRQPGQHRIFHD